MAFKTIDFSALPVMGRGPSKPQVSIAGNGQIRPTRAAVALINGKPEGLKYALLLFDERTREVGLGLYATAPKNVDKKVLRELSHNKDKTTKQPVAGLPPYFGAASALVNEIGYDYKSSGNQTFNCELRDGLLVFTVPEKLTPRPKAARKSKGSTEEAPATEQAA